MKKNLLNFSVKTIVVMAILIIFTMCKRETDCSTCVPRLPDVTAQISFNLMGEIINSDFNINKGKVGENNREGAWRTPDDKLFQFVKKYSINNNIPIDNHIFTFVLYYDTLITSLLNVTDEHIKGISYFRIEGRRLMHHLFVKNGKSEFQEIENVRVAVPYVSPVHIDFYLDNYVFTDSENKNNKSDFLIMSSFMKEVEKNIKKYRTNPNRFEIIQTVASTRQPSGNGHCANNYQCPPGGDRSCGYSSAGSACGSDICSVAEADNTLTVAQKIERTFINIDLMHTFRDVFLYNSTKGETYVDDYYYLSGEYEGKIGLSLAVQTALFFRKFNPVMEACVNPNGRQSEIMFDQTLIQSLLELLDEYEAITTSREGKAILTSVKADVNRFNGKTLQELLAMFQ
ncbi:MAG: hypothetical protein FWC10_00400 [Lentimicrobiaceae bacterium]|nr:hypothetical protein [Lentimicrobiaceae bacterium]